ncbi:MAG: endonuclease III [Candidatus Woesearchaeota archaeon]|nr:endonuclease III [Candidatus Woesearchaeota archaeon]
MQQKHAASSKYAAKENAAKIMQILTKEYGVPRTSLHYSNVLQLLISTILSAQCTDTRVDMVTPALFKRYKTAEDFAKADTIKLEKIIRSTGFYHAKARHIIESSKMIVNNFHSKVPDTMENLLSLSGVGRKTANLVLSEGYGKLVGIVVDTHVTRLSYRLGLTKEKDAVKIEKDLMKIFSRKDWRAISHFLVFHGRAVCNARSPKCSACSLNKVCPKMGV